MAERAFLRGARIRPARTHTDGPPPAFGSAPRPETIRQPLPAAQLHTHPVGVLPAVQSLLYVLVAALFLMTFTVQPIRIPSSSMEPTLLVGDFLLLDKQSASDPQPVTDTHSLSADPWGILPPSGIERGDIVVFHDPVDDPAIHLVKRVIGLPGDRLHLRDGVVYLNGRPLQESYAVHRTEAQVTARTAAVDTFRDDFPLMETMDAGVDPAWWVRLRGLVHGGDVTVPPGNYFVMGDNRNDSEDSRYWGFVPRNAIVGKPLLIYFSWNVPSNMPETGADLPNDPGANNPTGLALIRNVPVNSGPTDFARWDRIFRVVR
jgi:signal peptidase I